jgi:hypothetical protein
VFIELGSMSTTDTGTAAWRSSDRSASPKATTPCLAAQYGASIATARLPSADETLISVPPVCRRCGSAAFIP